MAEQELPGGWLPPQAPGGAPAPPEDPQRPVFVRGLATPAGLSFDARGRLLIANRRTHQILAAHPDGSMEIAAEGLQTPVGAVELPGGDLLVSNIAGGIALVSGGRKATTINADLRSPGPGIVAADTDAAYVGVLE